VVWLCHGHRKELLCRKGCWKCRAVQEMEVLWPSGAALRGEASNHFVLR
jgi:hypothetical protein